MTRREIEHIFQKIREAEQQFTPDSAWMKKTREDVLNRIDALQIQAPSVSFGRRVIQSMKFLLPGRIVTAIRRPVLATLSIVGMVTGGSIMSVSAAEQAVPGDLLFPLKIAREQTRLMLTSNRSDKLKLKTEFIGRRGDEIKSIVASNVSQKPKRLQQAAEIVKRDLDTVKTQLAEVVKQEAPVQAAEAAKLVDKQSSQLIEALKDAKAAGAGSVVDSKVSEASVAAVNTGVKAVQVLIDSQTNPEAQGVVTNSELVQSISEKVQVMNENVVDAAQKLGLTVITTSSTVLGGNRETTSTVTIVTPGSTSGVATSSVMQVVDAQQVLVATKQLLEQNKLDQVATKLSESVTAVATIEKTVGSLAVSSSTAILADPAIGSASSLITTSSTVSTSSTAQTSTSSSSFVPPVPPSSTTVTSSTKSPM
ncbi:hypothetical protein FJZ48_04535 [Candidatus Uhrbacteria bacterium]|nr:hypothetical protein [Candidatus Uhrbacteria bacterium]